MKEECLLERKGILGKEELVDKSIPIPWSQSIEGGGYWLLE